MKQISATITGNATIWGIVLLSLAAAVPLLLPSMPLLIDLPGHVASYHVELDGGRTPALARYYAFEWRLIPNLGADILVLPLGRWLGVEPATKFIVAAIPALQAAGMMWLARQVHGRIPATSLCALPLVYAYPLTFGFVNSSLAVSLAILAFGLWLHLSRRGATRLRAAVFAAIAPIILATHIVGLGVLGLLAFGEAIACNHRSARNTARGVGRACLDALPLAWPLLAIIVMFWIDGGGAGMRGWLDFGTKARWLISILRERWMLWDLFSCGLIYLVAALPLLARRRFGWASELAIPAALIWLAAIILPVRLMGSEFASVRLIPVAAAISLLAIRPIVPLPRWATVAAWLFVSLRFAGAIVALLMADRMLTREIQALDHVERGSRIVFLHMMPCERQWSPPRRQHLGSFATFRRDAFVNDHFAAEDGQLLTIRHAEEPDLAKLPATMVSERYCPRWPVALPIDQAIARLPWRSVDYLWLVGVPRRLQPRDAWLQPLWRSDDSVLLRNNRSRT